MPEGAEKRKEKRIKVRMAASISYRGAQLRGETENLSRLGAYVETQKELPLGSELMITLALPQAEGAPAAAEIKCKASVFRSGLIRQEGEAKFYGLGVFFTGFPQPSDRDRLSAYIDLLTLQEEQSAKEALEQLKARRASSRKAEPDWQVNAAKCLVLLKQILGRLEDMYRLAKSKSKTS